MPGVQVVGAIGAGRCAHVRRPSHRESEVTTGDVTDSTRGPRGLGSSAVHHRCGRRDTMPEDLPRIEQDTSPRIHSCWTPN